MCVSAFNANAQIIDTPTEELEVLNGYLEAVEYHSIIKMVEHVSEDFTMYSITKDSVTMNARGKDGFNRYMIDKFKNEYYNVDVIVENIRQQGPFITFSEKAIFGPEQWYYREALVVYEVRDQKIASMWYYKTSERNRF